jgi:replicative DNA helicase
MLAMMLKDSAFAEKCCRHLTSEYLHSDAHKWLFDTCKTNIEVEGCAPSQIFVIDSMKKMGKAKRKLIRDFVEKIYEIPVTDPDFIKKELTDFSKRVAFYELFRDGQTLYNTGDAPKAYELVTESVNRLQEITYDDDEEVTFESFEIVRQQYIRAMSISGSRIPTCIKELDQILGGGLEKGRVGVLLAEPKKGKSLGLVHMGAMGIMQGHRVAHFVLEGTIEETVLRYQSRMSGIPYMRLATDDLTDHEEKKLEYLSEKYLDKLTLIPFNQHWEYTPRDVESKLKDLDRKGKTPDLCVIDYADLLSAVEKHQRSDMDQRDVYREIKRLSVMRKMATWTASQARRPQKEAKKFQVTKSSDISESYEKVRIVDFIASINQSPQHKKMGLLYLYADIYRANSCGITIPMICDFTRCVFYSSKYGSVPSKMKPKWID